ncbi:MAG: AAA family ATPase [Cytophagales bacterium]|nr:AAA family ATPase [Cytophagales bacterium]
MRIKNLHIARYKNLRNLTIDFDTESFIDVFVGKNGTGKSNLFEAIIEIFRQLYEDDYLTRFNYTLNYEKDNVEVRVQWNWEREVFLNETGNEASKPRMSLLPDNILIYYSGHNPQIASLINNYLSKFKRSLREANSGETRKFIGIGDEYKSLLLSILILQSEDCKARRFILEKLGIRSVGNELKITLKRPYFAKRSGYEIDPVVEETKYWKSQGITREFLNKLDTIDLLEPTRGVRAQGYLSGNDNPYDDKYILYLDVSDFQEKFSNLSIQELFQGFDNLKTIEMLEEISIEVVLHSGVTLGINQFSDGQFQSVYIYAIIEIFKGRNCISLLDEPDSFLHPEWQFDFLKQVFEITDQMDTVDNHVLMTSHSAVTLAPLENNPWINLFSLNNSSITNQKISKARAIETLSGGKIVLTESEARLNIMHFINSTSGAILFTEGISDEIILEEAWKKLFPEDQRKFEIQNAFDCSFLRNLIKRGNLFDAYPNRIFFALFDFDEAYLDWSQLGNTVQDDPTKCLTKKIDNKEGYSLLLPVPNIENISRQVINPHGGTYGKNSLMPIEFLFYNVPGLNEYYRVDTSRTDGFIKFTGEKVNFAKNVVPNLDPVHFEVFRPLFEFILSRIDG